MPRNPAAKIFLWGRIKYLVIMGEGVGEEWRIAFELCRKPKGDFESNSLRMSWPHRPRKIETWGSCTGMLQKFYRNPIGYALGISKEFSRNALEMQSAKIMEKNLKSHQKIILVRKPADIGDSFYNQKTKACKSCIFNLISKFKLIDLKREIMSESILFFLQFTLLN